MKTIATYNLKGGVGKTTFAVNLAYASARLSCRRTLLWDLDPQAAATWLLSEQAATNGAPAKALFAKDAKPEKLAQPTSVEGLDLLASDMSLRGLERMLFDLAGKRRLAKLIERLAQGYDRVILDCPPGLGAVADQMLRAADVVIVPVIPSPLSERAFEEVVAHASNGAGRVALLPVYSMVDRRRALHRDALARNPGWPVIPMASAIEQIASRRQPVAAFAPNSLAARAFSSLWTQIERKLAQDQAAA